MSPQSSNPGHSAIDLDQAFYRRVLHARGYAELLECRKIATRSRDERVLRAFVSAMFASKMHRDAISSCIRDYIGRRAIPSLLLTMPQLRPHQQMFQSRLLCLLGHWDAFAMYYRAMRDAEPLDANAKKSVDWFLTNLTPKVLPGMRAALASNDPDFLFFCAPYLHKYYPQEVSDRLVDFARDLAAGPETQDRALHMLVAFSPAAAVGCLVDCGQGYPLHVVLSAITELATAEGSEILLHEALRHFSQCEDDRRMAAVLFFPEIDGEARRRLHDWMASRVSERSEADPDLKTPLWLRRISQQLCRAGHAEWVSYLEAASSGGPLAKFARSILVTSSHPVGLRLLRQEIESAPQPEAMFRSCIDAVRSYRERAIDVLERVVATGHARLRERIEEVVAQIWPGKTITQVIEQHRERSEAVVTTTAVVPEDALRSIESANDSRPPRTIRRKQRITSVFDRDRAIADQVKELEGHCCQVCGRKLINARTGDPYAESHHIHPLGHMGSDAIDNVLCLCPLCHTLFHLGCIGIDAALRIHAVGTASRETLLKQLRLAQGRTMSCEAFRFHWAVLFIPPADLLFAEGEPDEE